MPTKPTPLAVTGDDDADQLLRDDPLALLLGMLLDQQIPMEWAFIGPHRLKERLGGDLDAAAIASMDPDKLVEVFQQKPSLHRYPKSMGQRTQKLCQHLVEHHGGDASEIWTGAADGADLLKRLKALPGFGEEKSKIFTALLAKRFGIRPGGWEQAAGRFSDEHHRSVADIDTPDALEQVRAYKQELKSKGKGKDG